MYTEFILWTAMPHPEKVKLGIETQQQFSEHYGLGINTPTRWKQRKDFEERVDKILKMWAIDKTPDVVHSIYRSAIKGNPMSQLLWLQYFKRFNPKTEVVNTHKVEISVNDIRFIIEGMPESYRPKFYGYIREIIDTGVTLRNSGELADGFPDEPELEDGVRGSADNDAQDLPERESDVLAASHPVSIRCDMEWPTQSRHYQGAARWW